MMCCTSLHVRQGCASSKRATRPAARGAATEVPECAVVHPILPARCQSVVTCRQGASNSVKSLMEHSARIRHDLWLGLLVFLVCVCGRVVRTRGCIQTKFSACRRTRGSSGSIKRECEVYTCTCAVGVCTCVRAEGCMCALWMCACVLWVCVCVEYACVYA